MEPPKIFFHSAFVFVNPKSWDDFDDARQKKCCVLKLIKNLIQIIYAFTKKTAKEKRRQKLWEKILDIFVVKKEVLISQNSGVSDGAFNF